MSKVARDKFGVKLKYPLKSCLECKKYPCFEGIKNCVCDFAQYGCIYYSESRPSESSGK